MHARFLAMAGAFILVAGHITDEDGSTASIFSDLETIMSEEQGTLRDQADSYNDYAEAQRFECEQSDHMERIDALLGDG